MRRAEGYLALGLLNFILASVADWRPAVIACAVAGALWFLAAIVQEHRDNKKVSR